MKKTPPTAKRVPVDSITLDLENFRIGTQQSQTEAIAALIRDQEKRIVRLARDITRNGLNPLENFALVKASTKARNNFVSLDGNRRLLALKLLRTPDLCKGTGIHEAIRKLAAEAKNALPTEISGIELDRDEAYKWIQRKHDSGLGGAGQEPWSTEAKLRFQAYLGKHSPALSLIDAVRTRADLTADEREDLHDVPLSTVERIILGDYFKKSLGIDYKDGKIVGSKNRESVERVWKRMALDLARGDIDVNDVRKPAQREAYIDKLVASEGGKDLKKAASPWEVGGAGATPAKGPAKAKPRLPGRRTTVVTARGHRLSITDNKAKLAFDELTKLKVDRNTLAAAIMIRLFLELTCIYYQKKHGVSYGQQLELKQRMKLVADHLVKSGRATEKDLKGIRKAESDQDDLCAMDTFNAYVHSTHFVPRPSDLPRTWDQLNPLFEAVWK